uniref:Putative secreted protein n=1 Tax=Ixodes ricinus TaxID=34613 RepID=A0A6B0U5F8_IXORI
MDLIRSVSLMSLLVLLRSVCTMSVCDQCAVQSLRSLMCLAISELCAFIFTFLLRSTNLSFTHLAVCRTYLKPHSCGIS